MKKIYIEGLGLIEGHFSGIGQYILGILRGIDETMERKKNAGEAVPSIKVVIPYDTVKKFNKFKFKHIAYKRFPLPFRIMSGLHHRNLLPPIDLWCGKGHYIFTRFVSMPLAYSKFSVIVYDISFEVVPQFSDDRNAEFLSPRTKKSVKNATKIFTISKNAKKEIVSFYKVPSDKVLVATPAADQSHFYRRDKKEVERVRQKYDIEGNYILALSNLEPRKNLDGLIDAFCNIPKSKMKNTSLLLVGVNGWKTEMLFKKIVGKVNQGYPIIKPSKYVHDTDKPAIISGASMLVYPSHYEGFGMPPLEALACGIPVICSDNSSLPEVVGSVAKLVTSTDTDQIAKAITSYIGNDSIKSRVLMDGPKQAEAFNWQESAGVYYEFFSGELS